MDDMAKLFAGFERDYFQRTDKGVHDLCQGAVAELNSGGRLGPVTHFKAIISGVTPKKLASQPLVYVQEVKSCVPMVNLGVYDTMVRAADVDHIKYALLYPVRQHFGSRGCDVFVRLAPKGWDLTLLTPGYRYVQCMLIYIPTEKMTLPPAAKPMPVEDVKAEVVAVATPAPATPASVPAPNTT